MRSFRVWAITVFSFGLLGPKGAEAYFVTIVNPGSVVDTQFSSLKTVTVGNEYHDFNGGTSASGDTLTAFLGANTETTAANGPFNSVNNLDYREVLFVDFQFKRSRPDEDAVFTAQL